MIINQNYNNCQEVILRVVDKLSCSGVNLSVFGSSVYGSEIIKTDLVKPDANSDVDFMVINSNLGFLEHLREVIRPINEGVGLWNHHYVDIISIRGIIQQRKFSLECMTLDTYRELCSPTAPLVVTYKQLITHKEHIGNCHDYMLFGFNREEAAQSRILPLNEGHIVIYPNSPKMSTGDFCLTIFQKKIITQLELLDESKVLEEGRATIEKAVCGQMTSTNLDPLSLLKYNLHYWEDSYRQLIRHRILSNIQP